MRVRLTDGTREVELEATDTPLHDLESTALRLLAAIHPPPDEQTPHPIGFAPSLDGVALDSHIERAEPPDTDQDDEPDEGEQHGPDGDEQA